MPIPCPCCRASNDAGPNCRRCKADLSLLFQLEANRAARLTAARKSAAAGRFHDALADLTRAGEMRQGVDVRRLRAAVRLLARDFPAALAAYHESKDRP